MLKVKSFLRSFSKYFFLLAFGFLAGVIILEIGLRFLSDDSLNLIMARSPQRFQLFQTDPNIGWRGKPNVSIHYVKEGDFDNQIQTNSHGLKDFDHPYEKPPGTFRILLLGDSVAAANQVPITEGFPYLVEECLNEHYQQPIEVINGGTSYYATTEELFFLQNEGLRYEPDQVLVEFTVGNDIYGYSVRKTEDQWLDALGGYLIELDETGQLKNTWIDWEHPSPYKRVSGFELLLRRYSRIYYILGHSNAKFRAWLKDNDKRIQRSESLPEWLRRKEPPQPSFREDLQLMMYSTDFPDGPNTPEELVEAWGIIDQAFSKIQESSASVGANVGVLLVPDVSQAEESAYQKFYDKYSSRYGADLLPLTWDRTTPNRALAQLLAEKNILSLDLLPIYREYNATHEDSLFFKRDNHLNPTGHQLTAEATCQWIIDNNLIE